MGVLLQAGPYLPFLLTSQAHCEIIPKEANRQEADDFQNLGAKHPVPGHRPGNQGTLQVRKRFPSGLWRALGWKQ